MCWALRMRAINEATFPFSRRYWCGEMSFSNSETRHGWGPCVVVGVQNMVIFCVAQTEPLNSHGWSPCDVERFGYVFHLLAKRILIRRRKPLQTSLVHISNALSTMHKTFVIDLLDKISRIFARTSSKEL